MTRWTAFAGITLAVLTLLLLLARASQAVVTDESAVAGDGTAVDDGEGEPPFPDGAVRHENDSDDSLSSPPADDLSAGEGDGVRSEPASGRARWVRYGPADSPDPDAQETRDSHDGHDEHDVLNSSAGLSTRLLLVNVAVSQGLLAAILVAGAWYAAVPASALGLPGGPLPRVLGLGVAFGLALSAANTLGGVAARRLGFDPSEELRELLAPDSPRGWALLLGGVLPIIAGFEELLFRGALVGAFAAGLGVSPWLLAVLSSVAFALGHGAQGPAGIAVTGLLGFVLAAGFILTGSLVVVVVAHYLVNALEFVVYEGIGVELA